MCLSNDRGKLVIMQNYNRYQTHMQDHLVFSQHFDLNTNFRRYIIFVGEIANRFGSGVTGVVATPGSPTGDRGGMTW